MTGKAIYINGQRVGFEWRQEAASGSKEPLCMALVHEGEKPEDVTALAFHLRMTGRLFVWPQGTEPGKHTRVIFDLDDGRRLFFDDTRKFGQVRALCGRELDEWNFWRELGPEPLELTPEDFARLFRSRKAIIFPLS